MRRNAQKQPSGHRQYGAVVSPNAEPSLKHPCQVERKQSGLEVGDLMPLGIPPNSFFITL